MQVAGQRLITSRTFLRWLVPRTDHFLHPDLRHDPLRSIRRRFLSGFLRASPRQTARARVRVGRIETAAAGSIRAGRRATAQNGHLALRKESLELGQKQDFISFHSFCRKILTFFTTVSTAYSFISVASGPRMVRRAAYAGSGVSSKPCKRRTEKNLWLKADLGKCPFCPLHPAAQRNKRHRRVPQTSVKELTTFVYKFC